MTRSAAGEGSSTKAQSRSRGGGGGGGMNSRINMTDMKRRATAILDFISRTQVELAGESLSGTDITDDNKVNGETKKGLSEKNKQPDRDNPVAAQQSSQASQAKEFKELSCVEMMDNLTRRLVKWQREYTN